MYPLNRRVQTVLRKVGIFWRLNTAFILILVGSAMFLTFFSFYKYAAEIRQSNNRYISFLVQNVEMKIQDRMTEYEKIALTFYDDEGVIKALRENARLKESPSEAEQGIYEQNKDYIQSQLYRIRGNQKNIVNVQFVTRWEQYYMTEDNGFRRGATIRNLDEFYQSDFYLLPQEKRGYPVWFDSGEQTKAFYKTEQDFYGLPDIMTLCTAVYAPSDRSFLGVLVMNIELKAFSGAMDGYHSYNDGNTFLVGEEGVLLWFNPSLTAPSFPKDERLYEEMASGRQRILQRKIDGQRIVLACEPVGSTNVFVVHVVNLNVLFANTYKIRDLCMMVLIITVIAGVFISYYVTKSISDPIQSLVKVMKKTGDGKWNERYKNSGRDEITILGERFNEMADKTNQLIEEVYVSEIRKQEISLNWKNAQLDALLMQINPHFLYNTLDIIRWEAMYEAKGESPVTDMIEKFSKLCRMGMNAGGKTVTLEQGLDHARTYLQVINFRHKDKIELETNIEMDQRAVYIPQFMLQPILENAVVHGFGDASSGYRILITAEEKGNHLILHVIDNGKGMTEEEHRQLEESIHQSEIGKGSIGLGNVNQRIRLYYGEGYGIKISSGIDWGTDICIVLPVRNHSEDMAKLGGGSEEDGIQSADRG